jgi:hypothetical protein
MPSALANAVMAKLYDVLTNGDATVPKSDENFFTWCTPGIPVDVSDFEFLTQGLTGVVKRQAAQDLAAAAGGGAPAGAGGDSPPPAPPPLTPAQLDQLRAADTARVYMQAENLARIVDFIPDLSKLNNEQFAKFNVQNNNGTLSDVYDQTLRMSQVMEHDLPQDVKQKIDKARAAMVSTTKKTNWDGTVTEVTGPSQLVHDYNDKMATYMSAALEYNTHRIDALTANDPHAVQDWAINANIYRLKVKAAMDDWIANGYKNDYEQIAAFIDQVQARDMSLLKAQYKDDLEKARLTGLASGSDFFFTSLVPGSFATSTGWTRFGFSSGDYSSRSSSSFSYDQWSASAGGGFLGIFGGQGSASSTDSRSEYHGSFNSDYFKLSFEICQVPIVRPWFKTAFLVSKTWRFDQSNPDVKGQLLSNGSAPPKGLLPAYPTSAVFVRKLSMAFGQSQGFSNFISQYRSSSGGGGGFVSFGPFFLGGSASHTSRQGYTNRDWGYSWDGQTMNVDGMQIVGFKCHVLPKSPSPDPSINAWI